MEERQRERPLGLLLAFREMIDNMISERLAEYGQKHDGERARQLLAEHERTYHGGLPAHQSETLPYTSSTKTQFVAVLTNAVARAVELGIRLHRQDSQFHRLEEGLSGDFAESVLKRFHQREPGIGDEPPIRAFLEEGRAVARVVNAAVAHHVAVFHSTREPTLPALGSPEWVDLYRN